MISHALSRQKLTSSLVGSGFLGFSRGSLVGLVTFVWTHQYLATFGVSIPATAALAVSIAVAYWLAESVLPAMLDRASRWLVPGAWTLIGLWGVAFGGMLSFGRTALGLVSVAALASEATAFCLLVGIACLLLVPPFTASMLVATGSRDTSAFAPRLPTASTLCGFAVGLVATPTFVAPLVGLVWLKWLIVLASGIGVWRSTVARTPIVSPSAPSVSADSLWYSGLSLLVGLQVPLLSRVGLSLVPGNAFEHDAVWAGLLGGIAYGIFSAQRGSRRGTASTRLDDVLIAAAIAACTSVIVLGVWGLLVDAMLAVNSTVSSVPIVMGLRVLLLGVLLFPSGVALGRLWGALAVHRCETASCIAAMIAGVVVMRSLMPPPAAAISIISLAAIVFLVGRYWTLGLPAVRAPYRIACGIAAASVACLPLAHSGYRPAAAAKLLFSTQVFAALQQGVDRDLLPHLDDGRLVALKEGRASTWTLWKHRGSQLAFRENGLPRGVINCSPTTSPQFAAEVMPAVVPLVLHERPESVLMLGVGSSAPLTSVLACPISSVTCFERDADLIELLDGIVAREVGANPLNDSRVTLINVDPTLALLSNAVQHDVVIVNESQPSVVSSIAGFTREFYEDSQRALTSEGILCQRLQYADFGRDPIIDLLATVQSVFPQVALLDAAPGEMLIVATCRKTPLVDEAAISRCESAHIRNLLAQAGWDWSVLLNLGALSPETVAELTESRGDINCVANGRFAYGLPREVMRWSPATLPKWKERQQLLTAHASRMLAWVPESDRTKELQQRLADVVEQQRLIAEHPDHFWAYRKSLKERLTERPRAVIQQIKHEGLKRSLHPEDARRKEYLEVLGAAATTRDPRADDIQRLSEFAVPYDPLVSYFLHQEAARLYQNSSEDDPLRRFQHLQYSVYFGPPNDRSLRNVVQALKLLCDEPTVVPDPADRWDEMNSLLDVLKQRASLRLRFDDSASSFELIDAERSIRVAKQAMDQMDQLCDHAGIPESEWQHRKTVLQRNLVRPMWTYHSQQSARISKLHAQRDAISARRDTDSATR